MAAQKCDGDSDRGPGQRQETGYDAGGDAQSRIAT